MMRKILLAIVVLFVACRNNADHSITISINRNSSSVNISGLPLTTLRGMEHDSLSTENFQTLFPVYKMPADTEMRNYQNPIKGKYLINDSRITFTPDTPFIAGQAYFARWYKFDKDISAADMITNRRKPGEMPYTEMIFKY